MALGQTSQGLSKDMEERRSIKEGRQAKLLSAAKIHADTI